MSTNKPASRPEGESAQEPLDEAEWERELERISALTPEQLAEEFGTSGLSEKRAREMLHRAIARVDAEQERAATLAVVDLRGNLPRIPPNQWSLPEMARDSKTMCMIDAEGVRLRVALSPGRKTWLAVAMKSHRGGRVGDELAARILRRFRACDAFVEDMPDPASSKGAGRNNASEVRVFSARAHAASPDTWAAVRLQGAKLIVEPPESDASVERSAAAWDIDEHMPTPVPGTWMVEIPAGSEDTVRRISTPGGQIIAMFDRAQGSDVVNLAVGVFPPDNAHYVTDDRARDVLRGFRRRGAFEEKDYGPFAAAPGMRVFVAPTHR